MKPRTLSVLLLLLPLLAAAQDAPVTPNISMATELSEAISGNRTEFVRTFDTRFNNDTRGSQFVQEEWLPGRLVLLDSSYTNDGFHFRLDAYSNEVWTKKPEGKPIIPDNKRIARLELRLSDGQVWHFRQFPLGKPGEPLQYGRILFMGKNSILVKQYKKTLVKADFVERGVYTTGKPYDRIEDSEIYFLQRGSGPFEKVSLKKSTFTELTPASKAKQVEDYCKEQKIGKSMTEPEAARLLQFMDRL
jgi:hypothetical protein